MLGPTEDQIGRQIKNYQFSYKYTTKDKHEEKKDNTVTMVDKKRKYNIESL